MLYDFFVAVSFTDGGSLGYDVKAMSEQDAYFFVKDALPRELSLKIKNWIAMPKTRINRRDICNPV
jgi:hypothetical protein